jgi:uncharacterized protein (TIGR01777 family)
VNKNILITGASGLIGTRLTELLHDNGDRIAHLSRTLRSGKAKTFLWDVDKNKIDSEALKSTDAIIHLAGAGIADKSWSKSRKIEIVKSRVDSTRLLYEELKKGNHKVRSFISASAIGIYRLEDHNTLITEASRYGTDFISAVVRKWEEEINQIATLGIRVVKIRIGIVLSEKGGALKEMMRPINFYAGAPLGSGEQSISWIHLDDLCNIFIKAVEDETMEGVYNGVAPNPVTNKELTKKLASALHKPIILPSIPAFVVKILLGEMGDLVLKGGQVSSHKIQKAGFEFKFNKVEEALEDLLVN